MKFKFSKDLDYQLEAISSTVQIFDTGKNLATRDEFTLRGSTQIVKNELDVDPTIILRNLQAIQKTNNIEQITLDKSEIISMDFSIEMETGTGKTYVYLRTIHELHRKYGLRKFIILVPSVAIREGVAKTISQTRDHFHKIYNFGFGSFTYDSDHLSLVREFTQSTDLQIMIMTVQSFKGKDNLVMRQTPDRFHGDRPIDLVATTRPVVIMDEPQNMESKLSKEAIADLNPLFKLRYSATHREIHNLVYSLTPISAYKKGLVKKISIWGVEVEDAGAFQFRVNKITTKKGEYPKAYVVVEVKLASGEYDSREIILRPGDNLERKTKNPKYAGLDISDVNAKHNRVELSDGTFHSLELVDVDTPTIFRTQIHETIKAHMDKQVELGDKIKVLSLFFIDKVDNYMTDDGLIKKIFQEEYAKLHKNYPHYAKQGVDSVHRGYFASKKHKGAIEYKDTSGKTKADKDTYNLIMKDKERLLSFQESVSFIFSHSALKEGWDNPNVFQICTLREGASIMRKRQEIGRGLRLAVNTTGERIYDDHINVLTVIASESYQQYAGSLQREFVEAGYDGDLQPRNARDKKITVHPNKKQLHSSDFLELWNRISKKTKYNLEVYTDRLIKKSVEEIDRLTINNPRITVERGLIYFDSKNRIQTVNEARSVGEKLQRNISIPNILSRIATETGVTQTTVFKIVSQVTNLEILFDNPEEYIRSVILIILTSLNNLLINDGLKYIPTGDIWEISLFAPFQTFPSKSIESRQSVFDHVVYDSKGERQFAESLEQSRNVKVYTKLPHRFRIDTPLGQYNPDWAIVWKTNEGDKLYLVRETKFGYNNLWQDITLSEIQKIKCSKKHFEAIGFDGFDVSEKDDLVDLVSGVGIKYS